MSLAINRLFFSFLLVFSCLSQADVADINRIFHQTPSLNQFEVCQGGGCAQDDSISLTPAEWQSVATLFLPAPTDAQAERKQIALAIGLLEEIVGKKVGTSGDLAGTLRKSSLLSNEHSTTKRISPLCVRSASVMAASIWLKPAGEK